MNLSSNLVLLIAKNSLFILQSTKVIRCFYHLTLMLNQKALLRATDSFPKEHDFDVVRQLYHKHPSLYTLAKNYGGSRNFSYDD